MAEHVRVALVGFEILGHDSGLWCRRCGLPSAVRAYVAMRLDDRMSLLTRDQCRDCGSHDVEVP